MGGDYLIKDVLPARSLALIYGAGNNGADPTGQTYAAISMALAVGRGSGAWADYRLASRVGPWCVGYAGLRHQQALDIWAGANLDPQDCSCGFPDPPPSIENIRNVLGGTDVDLFVCDICHELSLPSLDTLAALQSALGGTLLIVSDKDDWTRCLDDSLRFSAILRVSADLERPRVFSGQRHIATVRASDCEARAGKPQRKKSEHA